MKKSDWKQATWYLVFCCMVFNWGNVLFGIDVSSFGGLQALPSWLRQFGTEQADGTFVLETDRRAIMNGVVFVGKLVGAILFEPVIERIGCKKTLYVGACIQILGIVLELSAKEWIQFSTGRVLTYLAVGLVDTTVPTYEAELAPAPLRGFFAGNVQVFVHVGAIWGSSMSRAFATETGRVGWMVPVGVQMIPAIMLLLLVPFCIESPRWLVYRGRKDEAVAALNKIRPQDDVDQGLTVSEADAVEQALWESRQQGEGQWVDLVKKSHRGRTIIATVTFFFNQTTGQQFANSYGPTFYRSIGLGPVDTFTYSILIPVVGLVGCLSAVALTDIIGRRPLCYMGALGATLFSCLIATVGAQPDASTNPTKSNIVVASVILLNGVCKFGVASQCYLIASEIGGTQMRKKMLAWATIADVLFAFLTVFNIPYLQAGPVIRLGPRLGFVFMVLAILSFLFFVFFLPELKGRSLEEVDELFERNLWAWQFNKAETHGVGAQIRGIERGHDAGEFEVKREDTEGDGSQQGYENDSNAYAHKSKA